MKTLISVHDFTKQQDADRFAAGLNVPECDQTTVQKTKRLKRGEEMRGGRYVVEVWKEG